MLKNPYTRIAIAAGISTLIAPRIFNAFGVMPEAVSPSPNVEVGGQFVGLRNDAMFAGIQGATTAFIYVLLGMAVGPAAAA